LAALAALAGVPAPAAKKKKKQSKKAEAIIAGTVFESSGLLLRGAKVEAASADGGRVLGRAVSDSRGEFAIRVPAGRADYIVAAEARGFERGEKKVEVYGDEKVRISLILSRR